MALFYEIMLAFVALIPLPTTDSQDALVQLSFLSSAAKMAKSALDTLGGSTARGVFLRTLHGKGCLDSGCCTLSLTTALRLNPHCPTWPWLKWTSDGPLIVNQRPLYPGCLECADSKLGCIAKVSSCHGRPDQQWRLKFSAGWKTEYDEPIFAISSFYEPDRCLTFSDGGSDGDFYALRECEKPRPSKRQSFYVVKNILQQ